ncbi:hypothetical protein Scep_007696 [Stephania cephalantha]|uniref:Uncharacterized protein n=1 Tax=Stephania cephalantha TaxID=152367 RepID=A0AAP0KCC4_9MAGN
MGEGEAIVSPPPAAGRRHPSAAERERHTGRRSSDGEASGASNDGRRNSDRARKADDRLSGDAFQQPAPWREETQTGAGLTSDGDDDERRWREHRTAELRTAKLGGAATTDAGNEQPGRRKAADRLAATHSSSGAGGARRRRRRGSPATDDERVGDLH